MRYLSADCIIPIVGDPYYNGVLAVADDGTIDGLFDRSELKDAFYEIHHYTGILCPGFVNTHCHLELSWAKGLIPGGTGLDGFIRQLRILRQAASEKRQIHAAEQAFGEMEQAGTVATADIANRGITLGLKSSNQHYFHTFVEVFGSDPAKAGAIFQKASQLKKQFEETTLPGRSSIVPHATYSLSEELFRITGSSSATDGDLLSIHHQENTDENLFFTDGSGPAADRRKAFNPHLPPFEGTGKRPAQSIAVYFNPEQKILFVHNTVSEQQDIDFVNAYFRNAYWCFCPNANLFIENRLPEIELFRKSGCRITLGTDSLASNRQLSIWEEIKTIRQYFPHIPLTELLRWGTLNGAEFLGVDARLGSFETGKKPGVVLIENLDTSTFQLNPESTSRLLIPAGK